MSPTFGPAASAIAQLAFPATGTSGYVFRYSAGFRIDRDRGGDYHAARSRPVRKGPIAADCIFRRSSFAHDFS